MSRPDFTHDASRRQFHRFVLASLAASALPAAFAGTAGTDWQAISPPQKGDDPGRIEVLEFFSWGCPHCRDFNPLVSRWAGKLPKDVAFRRVPVTFGRAAWENLSRLFYALEIMGELKRLDEAVFSAIHDHHIDLYTEAGTQTWVRQQGLDARRFGDAFHDFSTETRMARAEQLINAYDVKSVPMLAVAGRYKLIAQGPSGHAGMLASADELIAKVRKERPKAVKR